MNLLDFSISLVIVLFVLSIMTEKLTQLVKDYPTVFNSLMILTAVAAIGRGWHLLIFLKGNELSYIILAATTTLSPLFLYLARNQRISGWNILVFLALSIFSVYVFPYNIYIFLGVALFYVSLSGFGIRNELTFEINGKSYDTRFFKRIHKRKDLSEDTLKREKEITALSFLTGVVVAFLFRGDFFTIVTSLGIGNNPDKSKKPEPALGWAEFPFEMLDEHFLRIEKLTFDVKFVVGLLLTGFFLSFGSKFFHDLLETLFYAKKAKMALKDPQLYQQTSAESVQVFVNEYDIEDFYYNEKKNLLKIDSVSAVGIGKVMNDGKWVEGIRVYASQNDFDTNKLFVYEKTNGKLVKIPHQVFLDSSETAPTAIALQASDSCRNSSVRGSVGSFGFPVTVKKDNIVQPGSFLISCYHVVKHTNHDWEGFDSANTEITVGAIDNVGRIIAGARNCYAEASLIELINGNSIKDAFFPTPGIKIYGHRKILSDDKDQRFYMYSRVEKKIKEGKLVSHEFSDTIYFNKAQEPKGFVMDNLLEIHKFNSVGHIQSGGDSGSILFDEYGYAVGIVFARRLGQYTLAMRIDRALSLFNSYGYEVNLKNIL